jgi:hypothetical protein
MRGEVEIWDGDKLLHKEPNMLVDGAGELLADIMTVSPSLSGVADHATSSILDSSNYTIQAISFGTGSDAFRDNGYKSSTLKNSKSVVDYSLYVNPATVERVISLVYPGAIENFDGSSYRPVVGLPTYPDPVLKTLDVNTTVSSVVLGAPHPKNRWDINVSSIVPGNGQLVNFIPSAIYSSVFVETSLSAGVSGFVASNYLGAFAEGSSIKANTAVAVYKEGDISLPAVVFSGDGTGSFFNEVSSMDLSGFVNMVMSGSPGTTTGYAMSSGASGLCVSGGHIPDNSPTFGIVEYSVMVSKNDMLTTTIYGGIYHLGLWTINMKESLLKGNTPPFGFSVLNNPRKYKLFARKGFSKNLGYINDGGGATDAGIKNYKDLTIKWRLHFL